MPHGYSSAARRNVARRLDHRSRRGQERAREVENFLATMRDRHATLHRVCQSGGVTWVLDGRSIPAEIATDLLNNENVVGTGDFLLGGLELSQTFRWRTP